MRFADFPSLNPTHYQVDVPLCSVDHTIRKWITEQHLNLMPPFQRGHVWTLDQRQAYAEFLLRDGDSSRTIFFNHPGWHTGQDGPFVIVDGLQRLTTVRLLVTDQLPVFGDHRFTEFADHRRYIYDLRFAIADLPTEADVLKWYLAINAGGTPHTTAELDRVRRLLAAVEDSPKTTL